MSLKSFFGFSNMDDQTFDNVVKIYLVVLLFLMVVGLALSSCTSTWFIQKNNSGTSASNSTETSVDSTKINLTPNLQLPK